MQVAWHFPISKESGREEMIDPTTYFLAYFYPRVAVYDDYAGWDRLPFLDSKEFYNDFNDYTLRVKAPANYIVWATGTLQNPKQVLQPAYAKKLQKSMTSDELFKKCLHTYMDRWHSKHPIPWDYFNTMSNASGQDLSWFFQNWFFTNNYIDLALTSAEKTAQGAVVTIKNVGGFAVPVDLKIDYADDSTETLHRSPELWRTNQQQAAITVPAGKAVRAVSFDHGLYLDVDTKNDRLTVP